MYSLRQIYAYELQISKLKTMYNKVCLTKILSKTSSICKADVGAGSSICKADEGFCKIKQDQITGTPQNLIAFLACICFHYFG
jgi:hypothetical protein